MRPPGRGARGGGSSPALTNITWWCHQGVPVHVRQLVWAGIVDGVRWTPPGDCTARREGPGGRYSRYEPRWSGNTGAVRGSTDRPNDEAALCRQYWDHRWLTAWKKSQLHRQVFSASFSPARGGGLCSGEFVGWMVRSFVTLVMISWNLNVEQWTFVQKMSRGEGQRSKDQGQTTGLLYWKF